MGKIMNDSARVASTQLTAYIYVGYATPKMSTKLRLSLLMRITMFV